MKTANWRIRYQVGLAFTHLLTAVEVVAVLISLSGQAEGGTAILLREKNLTTIFVLAVLGTLAAAAGGKTAPGVPARLVMTWVVTSALPSATIVVLVFCRLNGWFIGRTASVEVPVVVLRLSGCSWGCAS